MSDLDKFAFDFDAPLVNESSSKDEFSFDFDDPQAVDLSSVKEDSPFDFDTPPVADSSPAPKDSEFNFDLLQSTDADSFDDESIDLVEQDRIMLCICPKCTEKTEVDLASMPEAMFAIACSGCNKQIHIIRESSACRAKRKSTEINCTNCGKLLDHHAYCHTCGKSFPDYFVTVNPDEARSKSRKAFYKKIWTAVTNLNVSFNPSFEHATHDDVPHYSPVRHNTSESSYTSRRFLMPVVSLVVIIALSVGGVFAFKSYKAGQAYAENYIKALYCIKTGVEVNLKKCAAYKAEWESVSVSGRSFSPSVNPAEEAKAVKLRAEIDKYMQKMNEPPKKFAQATVNLKNIQKIYVDTESLVQTRTGSLQDFSSSIGAINKKMVQASQELKSTLPDTLKQELEKAKLKYRGLKDF